MTKVNEKPEIHPRHPNTLQPMVTEMCVDN